MADDRPTRNGRLTIFEIVWAIYVLVSAMAASAVFHDYFDWVGAPVVGFFLGGIAAIAAFIGLQCVLLLWVRFNKR